MKNKIIMQKGSIDPSTIPAIKYCKKHGHYINLYPTLVSNCSDDTFRVVCPDCGSFGSWAHSVKEAIEIWNKKHGASL